MCVRPPKRGYMHAIIETGGKQYVVAQGDVVRVEKLDGDVGSEVEFPAKAAFQDGGGNLLTYKNNATDGNFNAGAFTAPIVPE